MGCWSGADGVLELHWRDVGAELMGCWSGAEGVCKTFLIACKREHGECCAGSGLRHFVFAYAVAGGKSLYYMG